jgi:O-6-methylguanine DNA methyltransferase
VNGSRLWIDRIAAPPGALLLVAAEAPDGPALVALDFEDRRPRLAALLAGRFGQRELAPASDPFGLSAPLAAYLEGDLDALQGVPVWLAGSPFQRRVWQALREIPPGATESYGALARRIGRPGAARAVGHANARNPVALVVPCHRVIGAAGALTGYAGGIARKRWLLAHEAAAGRRPQRAAAAAREQA